MLRSREIGYGREVSGFRRRHLGDREKGKTRLHELLASTRFNVISCPVRFSLGHMGSIAFADN